MLCLCCYGCCFGSVDIAVLVLAIVSVMLLVFIAVVARFDIVLSCVGVRVRVGV